MPHPIEHEPTWALAPDSQPRQYARPLQGPEIMHDLAARYHNGLSEVCMSVVFHANIPIPVLEERTRAAIARLRYEIPVLACAIVADAANPMLSSWVYTEIDGKDELYEWADDTLTIRHGAFDTEEVVAELNAKRTPYTHRNGLKQPSHFYLLISDDDKGACALFMHGPHTIMDGRPVLRCLDALLGWVVNPPAVAPEDLQWGEEWKKLPACPIAATGGTRDDWDTAGVALMKELDELLVHPVQSHSLHPKREAVADPGKMVRVFDSLDAEATGAIAKEAKRLGYSISALFDAAVALATFAANPVAPEDEDTAHFTLDPTVISQDRYLVPPHNGLSHFIGGLALVILRFPYATIDRSSKKASLASLMSLHKQQMDHFLANANLPHILPAQLALNCLRTASDVSNPDVSVTSNLGNANSLISSKRSEGFEIDVKDIVVGHRLPWRRIMFHCWSVNKEMKMQIEASDVWDKDVLQEYLGTVKAYLLAILDNVESSASAETPVQQLDDAPPPSEHLQNGDIAEAHPDAPPFDPFAYPGKHLTPTVRHDTYDTIDPLAPGQSMAGRYVFISSASGVIGSSMAASFARAGASGIAITARSVEKLDEVERVMREAVAADTNANANAANGGSGHNVGFELQVLKIVMDVMDADSITRAAEQTRAAFGKLDTIVNLAASIDAGTIATIDSSEWWTSMETNVRGSYLVIKALLPLMGEAKAGDAKVIINSVSFSAHLSFPLSSGYHISKLALVRMSEIFHNELIERGINVYAVNPGTIKSPLSVRCTPEQLMGIFCDTAALAADTHVWLASRRRDWLSGRYVSCNWDMAELEQIRDEILQGDKLKMTFRV